MIMRHHPHYFYTTHTPIFLTFICRSNQLRLVGHLQRTVIIKFYNKLYLFQAYLYLLQHIVNQVIASQIRWKQILLLCVHLFAGDVRKRIDSVYQWVTFGVLTFFRISR